jgi:glycosyltransferase involved in cell wall biosynthesis
VYLWIERHVVAHADRVVFTTPSAMKMYADRYPHIPTDRWAVIANGYDEENFRQAEAVRRKRHPDGFIEIVHSGILYPSDRDPSHLFAALSALKRENRISASRLRIKLRATANDELFSAMIKDKEISDIVRLEPPIPYRDALQEMLESDGLLLLQASKCNHQIPAKLYEYMRARRPLLALTDPAGDTAKVMMDAGITTIARLDNEEEIKSTLLEFLELIRTFSAPLADERVVSQYSRRTGTAKLAEILDDVSR